MPEIKNSFLKGKMNKDFDERLVPNGEYRDALNIEVSTSEGSNVGVVKNILGNHRIEDIIPGGFTCVGSFADEKTNKIYWFVSSYDTDAVIEFNVDLYDVSKDLNAPKLWFTPIIVDKYVGTSKAVLKFTGQIITGISVIDNLLLWTDNVNNPRKINIDEFKKGTVDLNTHTQLMFDKGSFNGITLDLITGAVDADGDSIAITPLTYPFSRVKAAGERAWYNIKQLDALLGVTAVNVGFASGQHEIKHYRGSEYLGVKKIVAFDITTPTLESGTYFHAIDDSDDVITDAWEIGDVIFGNDVAIDIEERHITVIKLKPLNAPSVKINHSEDVNSISSIPNLFETKLPRFSYRYKYRDGEFSPFGPFTHPVFNAKYPKDTSVSNDTNIFYNKDNAYDVEEPYNKAMVNSIHSIELTDFITSHTPEDVAEIELLYKQEESPIIYSIGTVKRSHKDWHTTSRHQGKGIDIGLGKSLETSNGTYKAEGGFTKGKYTVTTENIYAALPANQLLRPWDNVPKKALAQEVTGNRVVYGNYVQNYDLGEDTEVSVSYSDRKPNIGSFDTQGLQHVKSQRNYQVGVVYSDKYGRETPVLTSTDGAINIPWKDNNGNNNASRSLQLSASVTNNFPEWVDSFKFFIKETSNPYYNLVMDRAWVTKSTYELDDSKGHIWISFPSSDRNKVSEEDYIILKKKIGTGEEQVSTENKFKIIDIQNNAPDAIKYQLVNYGQLNQSNQTQATDSLTLDIFTSVDQRIDKEVDTIKMDIDGWKNFTNSGSALFGGVPIEDDVEQVAGPIRTSGLYISWRRLDTDGKGVSSKKYKITNGKVGSDNYTFKLATKITKIDADIAHINGDSSVLETNLHGDLIVQIERKERKDDENFSGKFFVKISKNQVTDLIDNGNPVNILDQFQVTSKTASWYWQDDIGTSATVDIATSNNDYGLTNFNGFEANHDTSAADSIQNTVNNVSGNGAADGVTDDGSLKVTDWYSPWQGIEDKFGPTFFIDSMHMAAGQSEASNYAKYSCITWSGCTSGESTSAEDSSWSYPPLKTWITDFEDQAGLKKKLKSNSVWFNDDLISTSPLVPNQDDWRNKKVDGWVGPLQRPKRDTPTDASAINANHVNGLEGIITTVDDHAVGPRRWFSGMTSDNTEHGVGNDTKVYSNDGEIGRHFVHLSFFAPGKDLHTGTFKDADPTLFGSDSWAANLQGVWGGGVFSGVSKNKKYGTSKVHRHIMMEGNHDSNNNYRHLSPRPGVGVGYDLKYKELHARQWDPTFSEGGDEDNKIRDFIRNLHPGARFRFNDNNRYFTTDTVDGATSTSTAVRLNNGYITKNIAVGEVVSGEGVTVGTKVAAVNVDLGAGAGAEPENITLDTTATIPDGTILKFTATTVKTTKFPDTEVYTIKKVAIKKLYNHTSWRKAYNRYRDGNGYFIVSTQHEDYKSVEQTALDYLDLVKPNGESSDPGARDQLMAKIKQFGAAHNRRICYIIELDKSPTDATTNGGFNPLKAEDNIMSADRVGGSFCDIEFLDPVKSVLLSDLSKFPAIWELDPKKQEVDLDIYYEASNNLPVKINDRTNELFAPIGCRVEVLNSTITSASILQSWDNSTATFHPGFPKYDVSDDATPVITEIDYSGLSFKFIREDGGYTVAEASAHDLDNAIVDFKTEFKFEENIGENIVSGLSWYNSFSFGNGIESNRIKDDFNAIYISNGVKASTTTQEIYEEERKEHGLIYSGVYNSNSSVNDLNQFIMAEKITKDLNPTFGSIQKLFQRRISLIAFCEDRVVSIVSNKDTIFNADGNPQLIASDRVLGDANPFSGNYGISKNPESFARESYRTYFTDKQRGAVLRLSKDGLTPISKNGMHDWFRDNLTEYNSLIGTYDSYKEDYNLTLSNNSFSQNLLQDAYIEAGGDPIDINPTSRIVDGTVNGGTPFAYVYETHNVLDTEPGGANNPFVWTDFVAHSYTLQSSADIAVHEGDNPTYAIEAGALQAAIPQVYSITTTQSEADCIFGGGNEAGFDASLSNSGGSIDGIMFHADMAANGTTNTSTHDFTSNTANGYDLQYDSNVWSNINTYQYYPYSSSSPGTHVWYPGQNTVNNSNNLSTIVSRRIQRNNDLQGNITGSGVFFNRTHINSYIEFGGFGLPDLNLAPVGTSTIPTGNLVDSYLTSAGIGSAQQSTWGYAANENTDNVTHSSCFAGDEIHVQVRLGVFRTSKPDILYAPGCGAAPAARYGRNYIQPQIDLLDGNTVIGSSAGLDSGIINPNFSGTYYGTTITNIPTAAELASGAITADWDNNGGSRVSTAADITPYNCFHSTPFGGSDGDEGYSTGTISNQPLNFVDADEWQVGGSRTFSSTFSDWDAATTDRFYVLGSAAGINTNNAYVVGNGIPWYLPTIQTTVLSTNANNTRDDGGIMERDYIVSFSVKLKEYAMSDEASLEYNTLEPIKKVVDNLRIRIQNTHTVTSNNWLHFGSGTTAKQMWNRWKKPLFSIKDIKIKKGFSVLQANEEEISEQLITTPGVAPVPPVNIPKWVETNHNYFSTAANPSMWTFTTDAVESGNSFITQGETADVFGGNRAKTAGFLGGFDASGNVINYSLPQGFTFAHNNNVDGQGNPTLWNPSDYTFTDSYAGIIPSAPDPLATTFNRENNSNNSYTLTQVDTSNYIDITSSTSTAASDITHGIDGNQWTENHWYLVDVEYDNFTPGTDPGELLVYGVATKTGFVDNEVINEEGVGLWRGDDPVTPTIAHCKLVPTLRTEYGTQDTVLRGIFQIASDSWAKDNDSNKFTLRVLGCTNGIRITKIIPKNLTQTATAGTVTHWLDQAPIESDPTHSFSDNVMYYRSNRLCWELPASSGGINLYHTWSQDLVDVNTFHQGPWDLTFTISNNPVTNNHSGSLGGVIAVSDTGVFRGVAFSNIEDPGNYKISFDLTDNSDGSGWVVYKEDGGVFDEYTAASIETAAASVWTVGNAGNKIQFFQDLGEIDAQEYAISNISLTPLEQTVLVGNIGSWNINGFDINEADPFVYLNNTENYFVFDDCPIQDNGHEFISISQQVGEITNQFDKYKISFNHVITTGEIGIYYYNNSGYGFKITGIDSSTTSNFEQVVTIGEDLYGPGQDSPYDTYDSDLKNTFVIVARDNGGVINGYIDNISMVRVYTDEVTADKTITFNEAVNGWSSFKSFVPENGVSVSKKYFTFKNAMLFQHYIPKLQGSTGSFDIATGFYIKTTAEQADNYNEFYGVNNYSSIKAVVNPEPSTVKVFNTINYEGSQAYISNPSASEVTINNAAAWSSGDNILGWECSEIKTNLDSGSVIEFIKKEGKWFNYIKGLGANQALDTSRFSVQGIGVVSSAESTTVVSSSSSNRFSSGGTSGSGGRSGGGTGSGGSGGGGGGGYTGP